MRHPIRAGQFHSGVPVWGDSVMGAYMYAIQVKRARQPIHFDEVREFEGGGLTLAALAWVGDNVFSIHDVEDGIGGTFTGYRVSVWRTRPETRDERRQRVTREVTYMREYRKRQPTPHTLKG